VADPPYEWILIDAESIHDMDTTAVQGLEELIEDLDDAGITLSLCEIAQRRPSDNDFRRSHRDDR
jgi:MFS superfamily sulfate permease-like transporter